MSLISKIFNKKEENKIGGMQDYMTLIRVYFQAAIAAQVGITNIAMLPDLRIFKSTFHVPTEHNKLGLGEKTRCRKMLKDLYGHDDAFFKEKSGYPICRVSGGLHRAAGGADAGGQDHGAGHQAAWPADAQRPGRRPAGPHQGRAAGVLRRVDPA